jgi:hydrogenase maturation protein HypF
MNYQSMDQSLEIKITGLVQGVGFRPFVYRLARGLGLTGWVNNSAQGVLIKVEGNPENLSQFLTCLQSENPPRSRIDSLEFNPIDPIGYQNFEIRESIDGDKTTPILPDLSTCSDCLKEIFDPQNRRYHYPFTNCTNCGPRYSIIEALPYDRPNTSMKEFLMCADCQSEYENPRDRRFHAQPNACPMCGPQLALQNAQGEILSTKNQALLETINAIQQGKIVAIKGLGGFQLIVSGINSVAVQKLRERKQRPAKPFALMYPNLDLIKQDCEVNDLEEKLLTSAEAPIVILKKKHHYSQNLSPEIAPNNPYLGVMLPYTPLHHLLLAQLKIPLIATSANLSDEPICIDEKEALLRLGNIADLFLSHNRPIVRPLDDSIARIINHQETLLRRARGYAPFSIPLADHHSDLPSILAVGGHLKNTIAIAHHHNIYLSQHIGDLSNKLTYQAFFNTIESLGNLYEFKPQIIAQDAHPDYLSRQYADAQNVDLIPIQHHYAHILSCLIDNQLEPPVLGIAWDGTGYGADHTLWGGEFIHLTSNNWQRIAYFQPFKLPGGEKSVKEPKRIALSLLSQLNINLLENLPVTLKNQFTKNELILFKTILEKNLNSPLTSSVGRLFDGISSILGICHQVSFEGQAAMALEFATLETKTDEFYDFSLTQNTIVQWQPMLTAILEDLNHNFPISFISAKFHNTLVEIIVAIAKLVGEKKVVLTGGCFQNLYLVEKAIDRLKTENFVPYWHHQIPSNDGGISVGQIWGAIREISLKNSKM